MYICNMKIINVVKYIIIIFFLLLCLFTIFNIFLLNFKHHNLKFSVDSWNEEQILIILNSIWISMLAVLCIGILSVWINFIFIRIVFNDEIREAALSLLKNREKPIKNKEYPIDIYIRKENRKNKWYNIF